MKQLNFLVDDMGASQLSFFLIKELNKLTHERCDVCPIIFYANLTDHCVKPVEFSMMQMVEAFDHAGPTIATSLTTAGCLISMPKPHPKFFYVFDLEWMRLAEMNWVSVCHIMRHSDLILIARSESHKVAIDSCFNVCVPHVIDNWNMEKILEIT